MAFRLLDQFPQYCDAQNVPLAGGYIALYETGTTTPKNAYGDQALTINIGSTVELDSSGRTNTDVWLDGEYRVRLYDADDVLVDEADNVELPGGEASLLPALVAGKFLSNDGAVASWVDVREVPDPAGAANKVLSTDGEALIWIAKPVDGAAGAAGVSDTTSSATGFSVGSYTIQTGSGTVTATNSETASVAVVFPSPFTSVPTHVGFTVKDIAVASGDALVAHSYTNLTISGCTFNINIADRHYQPGTKITNNVPFTYAAFGVKTA